MVPWVLLTAFVGSWAWGGASELAKGVEAIIKPELLLWARTSRGLDVELAAKKATVKPEKLLSWESGDARPTVKQLRKLGTVYKRPLAVFYLDEPPKDFDALRDFRRLPGEVAGHESPELRYAIRNAHVRREIAIELYEELNERPPGFTEKASTASSPEKLGERIRKILGMEIEKQAAWRTDYEALNGWRAAIENVGVLVFQASDVDLGEMRGFSIGDHPLPAIIVNVKDSPYGRVFTMLHEFVHLLLRRAGICDIDERDRRPPEEQKIEVYCNRVAGSALVPKALLLADPVVRRHSRDEEWGDLEISRLSTKFGVSREALVRRLTICGLATEEFYRQKREELAEERAEKELRKKEKKGGFVPPSLKAYSSAGPSFTRLVLDSYHREKITSADLSDFLGVRLKHLPKIERLARGGGEL